VTRTYTVDGGAPSGSYTVPTADGSHTVLVTDTDTAGNTLSTSISFTLDKTAPSVSLSRSDANLTAGETATIIFAFSEAVAGFAAKRHHRDERNR